MIRILMAMIVSVTALTRAGAAETKYPLVLETPHGAVILPTERERRNHDQYRFAAARRVDNMLYVSGVIVGRRDGEGNDVAAFKLQVRRAFERLQATLKASGASFRDVVMVNTFHVWQGPDFNGTRDQQFDAFQAVVDEFLTAPYPAWTAVGTSGLLADGGIVEVQLIARIPDSQ
jgi:enamine deaminase RidA (YjgF/YER057c/UK114 family)